MRESQVGFEYSWADLRAIRGVVVSLYAGQIIGGVLGLLFGDKSFWFFNLWFGGDLASFPSFLLGLLIQYLRQPGSISRNRVMVRRLGLISLLLTTMAIGMPVLGI